MYFGYTTLSGIMAYSGLCQIITSPLNLNLCKDLLKKAISYPLSPPVNFSEQFTPFLHTSSNSGSLLVPTNFTEHASNESQSQDWTLTSPLCEIKTPKFSSNHTLSKSEKQSLAKLYTKLYDISENSTANNFSLSSMTRRYSYATMHGKQLGSHNSRAASSSLVYVTLKHLDIVDDYEDIFDNSNNHRLTRINYFCEHSIVVNGSHKVHLLINLFWLKSHPQKYSLGKPVTLWYQDLSECSIDYDFVPIQFVQCRSVTVVNKVCNESVILSVPVIDF